MEVLNFIAGLAEIFLAILLLIVTVLFGAICGGLWFGLRKGNEKLPAALDQLDGYVGKGRSYEHMALGYVAWPVVEAAALGEALAQSFRTVLADARFRSRP